MTEIPPTPGPRSRRLGLALLCLALAIPIAHLLWGIAAQRRLESHLRHLHAAGEPVYPADFATPVPPAGQNAADDLIAAGAILSRPGAVSKEFDQLPLAAPLTDDEARIIAQTLDARQDVLALAESAARKPQVHWPLDPDVPTLLHADLPGLNGARATANLLRADALLAHRQHQDDRALARIEQILRISQAVDRQPALISHLVATGLVALASATAEDLAPDLRIATDEAGVTSARVRAVIDQLLDDAPPRAGMIHALRGERKDYWLFLTRLAAGQLPPPTDPRQPPNPSAAAGYAIKPMVLGDADVLVRIITAQIEGFRTAPDLPAYRAAVDLPRLFPEVDKHPMLHFYSSIMLPSLERIPQTHYRVLAEVRLAATALAVRSYAADHAGQLPPTLAYLVPAYLPAVPSDPMAPGRAPIHYRPTAPDPILYSVGDDATDNGGSPQPARGVHPPAADEEPLTRWQTQDALLHLTRQPRFIPAPDVGGR